MPAGSGLGTSHTFPLMRTQHHLQPSGERFGHISVCPPHSPPGRPSSHCLPDDDGIACQRPPLVSGSRDTQTL